MKTKLIKWNSDFLGIISSFLCIVHCTVVPLILVFTSLNVHAQLEEWHWLHYFFIVISISAVYFSARSSYFYIKLLMWFLVLIFSTALLLHEIVPFAFPVSIGASMGLIVVHLVNQRLRNRCITAPGV